MGVMRCVRSTAFGIRLGLVLLATSLPGGAPACSTDPDEIDDPDLTPAPNNPDGVPYPTDNIGGRERAALRRGDRMPNLVFRGYRDPRNRAAGLVPISLADYFDPEQKRFKTLHIQIAATWCGVCSAELSMTVPVADALRARGAALLEVVISGETAGRGPGSEELESWISRHRSNVGTAIDVRGRRLAAIGVSTSVVPHDILIDTRTMEILDSSVGAPVDVERYVGDGLRFGEERTPSY